jgi:hypothetical protein
MVRNRHANRRHVKGLCHLLCEIVHCTLPYLYGIDTVYDPRDTDNKFVEQVKNDNTLDGAH